MVVGRPSPSPAVWLWAWHKIGNFLSLPALVRKWSRILSGLDLYKVQCITQKRRRRRWWWWWRRRRIRRWCLLNGPRYVSRPVVGLERFEAHRWHLPVACLSCLWRAGMNPLRDLTLLSAGPSLVVPDGSDFLRTTLGLGTEFAQLVFSNNLKKIVSILCTD